MPILLSPKGGLRLGATSRGRRGAADASVQATVQSAPEQGRIDRRQRRSRRCTVIADEGDDVDESAGGAGIPAVGKPPPLTSRLTSGRGAVASSFKMFAYEAPGSDDASLRSSGSGVGDIHFGSGSVIGSADATSLAASANAGHVFDLRSSLAPRLRQLSSYDSLSFSTESRVGGTKSLDAIHEDSHHPGRLNMFSSLRRRGRNSPITNQAAAGGSCGGSIGSASDDVSCQSRLKGMIQVIIDAERLPTCCLDGDGSEMSDLGSPSVIHQALDQLKEESVKRRKYSRLLSFLNSLVLVILVLLTVAALTVLARMVAGEEDLVPPLAMRWTSNARGMIAAKYNSTSSVQPIRSLQ